MKSSKSSMVSGWVRNAICLVSLVCFLVVLVANLCGISVPMYIVAATYGLAALTAKLAFQSA